MVVDRPTQLICIWIFICKYTNLKDTAGQSANVARKKIKLGGSNTFLGEISGPGFLILLEPICWLVRK